MWGVTSRSGVARNFDIIAMRKVMSIVQLELIAAETYWRRCRW